MASERVKLFSKIELEVLATGTGTLALYTDLPGDAMAQRGSGITVPMTSTRRTVRSRLPYNTQGHLLQAILTPGNTSQITLYRARVWARELPGGQWQWYELPVIDTPVEFAAVKLPIPPTPEEWSKVALPIPPTPEEWSKAELPIPPTPEEWREVKLPIPTTTEEWQAMKLPIKPTPDVPEWIEIEVDR